MYKLITYLNKHGVTATQGNGKINALSTFTLDGVVGQEWVELEPTLEAVRAFLGY